MSSKSIRNIVQAFLTKPQLSSLPVILKEWDNQMQLLATGITIPEQTLACIHIAKETESRVSFPAVTGWTMVDYTIQLLICHFMSDGQGSDIADALDDMIESVKTRIRSDPRMGQSPDAVWESGQGPYDAKIKVNRGDVTYINDGVANGVSITWVGVEWLVSEEIQA
jgi:hypothetical protein